MSRLPPPFLLSFSLVAVVSFQRGLSFCPSAGTVHQRRPFLAPAHHATKDKDSIGPLLSWASTAGIKISPGISISPTPSAGNALLSTRELPSGSVVLTCPRSATTSVLSNSDDDFDRSVLGDAFERKEWGALPWYAKMSVLLHRASCGAHASGKDVTPWLAALPAGLDTPLHWGGGALAALRYPPMERAVASQRAEWESLHGSLPAAAAVPYGAFEWGMEMARSRSFSSPDVRTLDVRPYALTALLVAAYVGLGLGPIEKAANGAAVVVCANILRDVVAPKLAGDVRRHVMCPVGDMANHDGSGAAVGDVELEYFSDAYALALSSDVPDGRQVTISYGERSNDQLLQYYGFVEEDNKHDVYVLPALGEWDLGVMEGASGRTILDGRLGALKRANLLGDGTDATGVVATRDGVDPAVIQGLRALLSNDGEWDAAQGSVGVFAEEGSGGPALETAVRAAAAAVLRGELTGRGSTAEEDAEELQKMEKRRKVAGEKGMGGVKTEDVLAMRFRIEKRKVLEGAIRALE